MFHSKKPPKDNLNTKSTFSEYGESLSGMKLRSNAPLRIWSQMVVKHLLLDSPRLRQE
jgi:hypothetical protein